MGFSKNKLSRSNNCRKPIADISKHSEFPTNQTRQPIQTNICIPIALVDTTDTPVLLANTIARFGLCPLRANMWTLTFQYIQDALITGF